jgi:hypothetical protein
LTRMFREIRRYRWSQKNQTNRSSRTFHGSRQFLKNRWSQRSPKCLMYQMFRRSRGCPAPP